MATLLRAKSSLKPPARTSKRAVTNNARVRWVAHQFARVEEVALKLDERSAVRLRLEAEILRGCFGCCASITHRRPLSRCRGT